MKLSFSNFFRSTNKPSMMALFFRIAPLTAFILFVMLYPMGFLDERSDFMLIAWNPGRELLTTGSIDAEYPYPAWTVVAMLPFALVKPAVGMALWFICNVLMFSASLAALITTIEWETSPLLLVVTLSSVFLPILTGAFLGQLTIFSLLMLALTCRLFLRGQWIWLGIVLGLTLIKPQVTILLSGALLLWALWQRRWNVLLGFGMAVMVLTIISIPAIDTPRQLIGGGIGSHLETYIKSTSTLWGFLMTLGAPWFIPLLISLALTVWLGWLWLPFVRGLEISPNRVLYLFSSAVMVNLIIIPYSWMHNLALMLLPLGYCFSRVLKLKYKARLIWLTLLFLIMHPIMIGIFIAFSGRENPQAFQIVPALLLLPLMPFLESKINPTGA